MKIWLISDTHQRHHLLKVPENIDMVICSGDVSNPRDFVTNQHEVLNFIEWYASLPIEHKVCCMGNHDTSVEKRLVTPGDFASKGITYLEHASTKLAGLNIYGSPYTPSFGQGWAFNVKRSRLDAYWAEIPENTDILITHGPPKGILDITPEQGLVEQCGCKALLNHVHRVKPLIHCFGHIHNVDECFNAGKLVLPNLRTTFVNASIVSLRGELINHGQIIEL